MAKRALVVWGGWEGHEPRRVAEIFTEALRALSFEVEVANTLDAYRDGEKLKKLDLIVPVWTMGKIEREQERPLLEAVKSGVGIGGVHGGMCDSFRQNTEYQFMTGGQWVSHPGGDGVRYMVNIVDGEHFITRGSRDFEVVSEQYYMHVDPANRVLATTTFPTADGPHSPNGPVKMPVVWTKFYGKGRVFYTSLGHVAKVAAQEEVRRIWTRGFLWAAHAEDLAAR
jgi:hypothetical protein